MTERVQGSIGLDTSGWGRNLKTAEAEAIAFMTVANRLRQVVFGVANGSITAAQGMAAMGATGAQAKEVLTSVASGATTAVAGLKALGLTNKDVANKFKEIETSGGRADQTLEELGFEFDLSRLKAGEFENSLRALKREALDTEKAMGRLRTQTGAAGKATAGAGTKTAGSAAGTKGAKAFTLSSFIAAGGNTSVDSHGRFVDPDLQKFAEQKLKQADVNKGIREQAKTTKKLNEALKTQHTRLGRARIQLAKMNVLWGKFKTKANTALGAGIRGAGSFASALMPLRNGMAFMTSSLLTLVTILAGAAGGAAVKWSADFEQNVRAVSILVSKIKRDISDISRMTKNLSLESGLDPNEIANAVELAVSTDVPIEEAREFTREAARLAVIGRESTKETVDLLTSLRSAYRLNIEQVKALGDIIFTTTDKGKVTIGQLGGEVGKLASLAKQAGLNVFELFSAFAALSLRRKNPEEAGTIMRNVLKAIIDQSTGAQKALDQAGLAIDFTPEGVRAQSFIDVIKKLKEQTKGDPDLLKNVAEDVRELIGLADFMNGGLEDMDRIMNALKDSTGRADEALAEMESGSARQLDRMINSIKLGMIELGDSMLVELKRMIDGWGGIAPTQLKILRIIRTIELSIRTVVLAATTGFAIVAASVEILWDGLVGIAKILGVIGGGLGELVGFFTGAALDAFGAFIEKIGAAARAVGFDEMASDFEEAGARVRNTGDDILIWTNDLAKKVSAIKLDPFDPLAWAETMDIAGQAEGIQRVSERIQQLGNEIEMAEQLSKRGAKTMERAQMDVRDAFSETRDKAGMELRQQLADVERFVRGSIDGFNQLKVTENSIFSDRMKALNKGMRDAERLYQKHSDNVIAITRKQAEYQRGIEDQIFSIRREFMSPKELMEQLKGRARAFEKAANEAAARGDVDQARNLSDSAIGVWRELLSLDGSEQGAEKVISAISRIAGEMSKLYDLKKQDEQSSADQAKQLNEELRGHVDELTARHAAFQLGVKSLAKEWKEVGRVTVANVNGLLNRIEEVRSKADMVLGIDVSDALNKIATLKKAVGDFKVDLQPEVNIAPNAQQVAAASTQTTHQGNINVNYIATGAGSVHDARVIAAQIARYQQRGETAK